MNAVRIDGVSLLRRGADPISGLVVSFDEHGATIEEDGAEPRRLQWSEIDEWQVRRWEDGPTSGGAVVRLVAGENQVRLAAVDQHPAALERQLEHLARAADDRALTRSTRFGRARPLLGAVLVLVVAAAVALVLAQSAGAIHIPLLGSNDGSGASAGVLSGLRF